MRYNIEDLISTSLIDTFDFTKQTYKDEMREIVEQIDHLIESIEFDISKFDEIRGINEHVTQLKKSYVQNVQLLQTLSNYLLPESDEESYEEESYESEENYKQENEENFIDYETLESKKINYNDKSFLTDITIPHTLYENFTYTRPAYMEINSDRIEGTQWKELYINLCNYLNSKNNKIFNEFLTDPMMKGKKYVYFSKDKEIFRDPRKILNSNIYTESNFSAQTIRNIIVKMLEKYKIPKYNCKIFLRKDYSSLHISTEKQNIELVSANIEKESRIKIGKLAKNFFYKYFQNEITDGQLSNFLDKEWCIKNLGIRYPLLKAVDLNKPISKQLGYNNQYGRYYATNFIINGKTYLLCSQWYEEFRPKLTDWIKNNQQKINYNMISNNTINEIIFSKDYGSVHIASDVLCYILTLFEKNGVEKNEIIMSNINKELTPFLLQNTNYKQPKYVINMIKNYLLDNHILKLKNGYKKNQFVIQNQSRLKKLINDPCIVNTND